MLSLKARYPEIVACLATLVFAVAACKGSSSSGNGGVTGGTAIGPEGGTAVIAEQTGDATGAKVYIPGNALEGEQVISLRSVPLPSGLPPGYKAAGPCISFSPEGTRFSRPVSLYLPYSDANNDGIVDGRAVSEDKVRVLYFNDDTGRWESMTMLGVEREANLAVAGTLHFSTYLVAVNTGDTQTGDSGSQDGDTSVLEPGDCLVGTGNLLTQDDTDSCFYYNLTVTRRTTGLLALVDRYATYVTTGIPAVLGAEGDSATFDASSAFAKVLASGDARLWSWECDFVKEHTSLSGYEVVDDTLSSSDTSGGIPCSIEAVDENMVRISWQVNVNEQILHITSAQGGGHCLVIRFRATYQ